MKELVFLFVGYQKRWQKFQTIRRENTTMSSFTREQWLTILTFVVVNFFNAMCASMQVRHSQSFYCSTAFKTNAFLNILTFVIVNFSNAVFFEVILCQFTGSILPPGSSQEGPGSLCIWTRLWYLWGTNQFHEFVMRLLSSDDRVSGQPVHWNGNKSIWSQKNTECGNWDSGGGFSLLWLPWPPQEWPLIFGSLHGTQVWKYTTTTLQTFFGLQ